MLGIETTDREDIEIGDKVYLKWVKKIATIISIQKYSESWIDLMEDFDVKLDKNALLYVTDYNENKSKSPKTYVRSRILTISESRKLKIKQIK